MVEVIIEMIARQVRVGAGGDATPSRRCWSRPCDDAPAPDGDALAGEPVERAMQFDRIGRGQRAVFLALRRHHADGADAGGLQTERCPDFAGEARRPRSCRWCRSPPRWLPADARRISTRPATARAAHWLTAMKATVAGRPSRPMLGDNRRRPCAPQPSRRNVAPSALVPANCDEHETALDLAAVRRHAGDIDGGKARIDIGIRQKVAQFHRLTRLLTSSNCSALGRSKRG